MPVQVDVEVGVGDERALQRQGGVAGDAFHLPWVVGEGIEGILVVETKRPAAGVSEGAVEETRFI